MGYYINPPDKTKEDFLVEHGTRESLPEFKIKDFDMLDLEGSYHVVLVDNGPFTAGLICNTKREYEYIFNSVNYDQRPMAFFTVPKDKLEPYLKD